jgi:hypothetical protein
LRARRLHARLRRAYRADLALDRSRRAEARARSWRGVLGGVQSTHRRRAAREAVLDQAAYLEGSHPLGRDREDRAREARLGLSEFERLRGLSAASELLAELVQPELVTDRGGVAPERGAERGVGKQPLDQMG